MTSARQQIENQQIDSPPEYFVFDDEQTTAVAWEVWQEGFRDQGYHFQAYFHGRFTGKTFQQALQNFGESLPKPAQQFLDIKGQKFWGCRLFDNGPAARNKAG